MKQSILYFYVKTYKAVSSRGATLVANPRSMECLWIADAPPDQVRGSLRDDDRLASVIAFHQTAFDVSKFILWQTQDDTLTPYNFSQKCFKIRYSIDFNTYSKDRGNYIIRQS